MINTALRNFTLTGAALALGATLAALPARADDLSDANDVVAKATATLNEFAKDPDYASLPGLLGKAKGVLIYPQIIEGGFVIGGSGGTGVLLARDASGNFSAPAFYTMGGVKIGFLAGGQSAQTILLINSQKALDSMLTNKVKLGGDASVAVGPKGAGAASSISTDFISYSKNKGAYAGMSLDGQVVDVRGTLNAAYYGKPATPVDILVKNSVSNPNSAVLQGALKAIVNK